MSEQIKVLYLFAGERKSLEAKWRAGTMPDSQLIGYNHLREFGVDASYIENRFLNFIRKKNFNLTNLFLLFSIRRYNVVFSGASLLLPFVAKFLFRFTRPKFVWYNTFFTNALKRNVGNTFRLWAFRKTIGSLDAIICPSTAQRNFLIEQGFDPAKIFFVPNGVDADFIDNTNYEQGTKYENVTKRNVANDQGDSARERFILSVGKDMGRDYRTLAEAVSGLAVTVKVVALPRNFREVKDIPPNLHILGFVPFDQLVELYKAALFVVVPTKSERHLDASDCSGQYVLLDAMSCGKAVVISERGTLADYVTDGEEGVIVASENPAALRAAIERLLANPEARERMGKRGREKVRAVFNTKRLAANLAEIFRNVLEK